MTSGGERDRSGGERDRSGGERARRTDSGVTVVTVVTRQ
jgi:hypothetical protein